MTRVLHTADVHLTEGDSDRMAALRSVLDRADEESVDAVTIGGDLFDDPGDVETLRTELRNDLFTDREYDILLIPGNHDVEAYRGDVFFGDACRVLSASPFEHWESPDGDLRITGVPYQDRATDDLLVALQNREPFEGTEALLIHCSLEAPFDDYETGDEESHRYFPVTEDLLTELEFDYYLAGHYHSPHRVALADGATFTYPGTPASTKTSETGRRRVSLLDTASGLEFETLETFHYLSLEVTVSPGSEEESLEAVRNWADQHVTPSASASVTVDGYIETGEAQFDDELAAAAEPAAVTNETRSVEHVRSHPLYMDFEAELAERDWDGETKAAVTDRTLEVFSHLAATEEI